jgi:signal transduction histidine kinase/serine/threonine protein kinase/CheY-like chemotaxis protein
MALPASDYEDLQLTYESSTTRVYRARRTSDQKVVAIKKLIARSDGDFRLSIEARLRDEFELLQNIDSPHVIRALEIIGSGAETGLVMHFATDCESLETWIAHGALNERQILEIAVQVAKGIAAIHRAGVLHKDIKPANILVHRETHHVSIIDFGIGSRIFDEHRPISEVGAIQGSLAYIAPEQTGRTEHGIDHRTDFYAFGVTLYELFAHRLPFEERDLSRLVHAHLARNAVPLHERNRQISRAISSVVTKLLEKAPERRYQSSFGLIHDLECCRQASADGLVSFTLAPGQKDRSERFSPAKGLFGRKLEESKVRDLFARVGSGASASLMVAGPSGVGKSALVHSVLTDLTGADGFFLHAKFEQSQRTAPYAPLLTSLSFLLDQLAKRYQPSDDIRLRAIRQALHPHGKVLAQALPNLESVFQDLEAIPHLGAQEHAAIFSRTLRRIFVALAATDHPLLLFVDDLQWADTASIALLRELIEPATPNLLLVLAYRDDEVDPTGPLPSLLQDIRTSSGESVEMTLLPLDLETCTLYVQRSLNQGESCQALAAALHERTNGNPFYIEQILKALHAAGDLSLDLETGEWSWDLAALEKVRAHEGVVGLLLDRLKQAPTETQHALACAALLGSKFSLPLLARCLRLSLVQTRSRLEFALRAGFIVATDDLHRSHGDEYDERLVQRSHANPNLGPIFRFGHDRIQEAAASLLDPNHEEWHFRIARTIFDDAPDDPTFAWKRTFLNHALAVPHLFAKSEERLRILTWILSASQSALASGAPGEARELLKSGRALVPENAWEAWPTLMTDLELARLQADYALGRHERLDDELSQLFGRCTDRLGRLKIMRLRSAFATLIGDHERVVTLWLEVLAEFGLRLPRNPGPVRSILALTRISKLAQSLRSPAMQSPNPTLKGSQPSAELEVGLMIDILLAALSSIFQLGARELYVCSLHFAFERVWRARSVACRPMLLSIYGVLRSAGSQDFAAAYEMQTAALEYASAVHNPRHQSFIWLNRALFSSVWNRGWIDAKRDLFAAHALAEPIGEAWVATMALSFEVLIGIFDGTHLESVRMANARATANSTRFNEASGMAFAKMMAELCHRFITPTHQRTEAAFETATTQGAPEAPQTFHFLATTLILIEAVHFARWDRAWEASVAMDRLLEFGKSMPAYAPALVYRAIAAYHHMRHATRKRQAAHYLRGASSVLASWHKLAPLAAEPWLAVLKAVASHDREYHERLASFDAAIRCSRVHELPQLCGLVASMACQTIALQDEMGPPNLLRHYLSLGGEAYRMWGAPGLQHALTIRFRDALPGGSLPWITQSDLRRETRQVSLAAAGTRTAAHGHDDLRLDAAKIVAGSLALAREHDLSTLLDTFIRLSIEISGATDGSIFMVATNRETDELQIELRCDAQVDTDDLVVKMVEPSDYPTSHDRHDSDELPRELLHRAIRNSSPLSIEDVAHSSFRDDSWLELRGCRSVLCLPIFRLGDPVAILFLAHSQIHGAFAPHRSEVVEILAAQLGLGLEHIALVQKLQTANSTLTQRNIELADALKQAKSASEVKATFLANMSHELRTPLNGVLGMADLLADSELDGDQREMLQALQASGQAICSAVTSILDLAELEAGDSRIHPKRFDPNEMLRSVCQRPSEVARSKSILFHQVSAVGPGLLLFGDLDRLTRVLEALLDNACKFTAEGEVSISMSYIDSDQSVGSLIIEIKDTGPGLSPRAQADLFANFIQGDSSTTKVHRGLGVGLAMVRRALDLMQGQIQKIPLPRQGLAFRLTIPFKAISNDIPIHEVHARMCLPKQSFSVLVAEDDPINQRLLAAMLQRVGYRATIAKNGLDALHHYRHDPTAFDAVFMDCQMPVMDGYESTASIRAFEQEFSLSRVPIVAITANAMTGDRDRCLGAGMDDYVTKPISLQQIASLLDRLRFAARPDGASTPATQDHAESEAIERSAS